MEKPKRKIKIKFPLQQIRKIGNSKEDTFQKSKNSEPLNIREEELEEIVSEQPKNPTPRENISPSLEMAELTLEAPVANAPETKKEDNLDEKPIYESIKYSPIAEDYQEFSYQSVNFTPPSNSISLDSSQQNFFRNPIAGFRQANPFNPSGYPRPPEKNYESSIPDENKRKRRM